MAKKKRKKKVKKKALSGKASRSKASGSRWLIVFNIFIVLLIFMAAYVVWLDYKVSNAFEGKRWLLPARVYAKPQDIFVGMRYTKEAFIKALESRGYQSVQTIHRSGQYSSSSGRVQVYTRRFAYWDRIDEAQHLTLDWQTGTLARIQNNKTRDDLVIFRLEPTVIGKIYPSHQEDRVLVPYDEVPNVLVDTLVAVEDRNFYRHSGFDPKGFLRAVFSNIKAGRMAQGGSTLTQQLVKNLILSNERSLIRKINELFMALLLERRYSKAEIMSSYINEVYLGQDGAHEIHGFGTAAEYYFARPLNELDDAQIALLVGMVKGASLYNPRKNPETSIKRRDLVLQLMHEQLIIDDKQLAQWLQKPLRIIPKQSIRSFGYDHFLAVVKEQLLHDYDMEDLKTEGLRIFTTMDKPMQDNVLRNAEKKLLEIERSKGLESNRLELAAIISQVDTGEILALTGSRKARVTDFNRAMSASRPIGSLVKPYIYLNAVAQPETYTPLSLIQDSSITISQADGSEWSPQNYDRKEHGQVPLYEALSHSYNLASVRLGMELGLENIITSLQKAGINKRIPAYPSLLLGAVELTPMQVMGIYQPLASNGFKAPLKTIDSVLDKDGLPLERRDIEIRSIFKSSDVSLLNGMMSQVFVDGTAKGIANQFRDVSPLAGKTGTTNDLRDSWFVGYGSNLLGVVWTGRDDNKNSGLTGASGAMKVWAAIMPKDKMSAISQFSNTDIEWLMVKDREFTCHTPVRLPFYRHYKPAEDYLCH